MATAFDHVRVAQALLDASIDVGSKEAFRNQTALHTAAEWKAVGVARLLIEQRAYVDEPDKYGRTPLHIAAEWDSVAVAHMLLRKGANLNSRAD